MAQWGDDFNQHVHDLLADIRAVATSVANPASGFAQNAELGMRAYGRGPEHAVLLAAQIAAIRLRQIDETRESQGQLPTGFPKDELAAATIRLTPLPGRRSAPVDALDYLEEFAAALVLELEPIVDMIQAHGLLAFMSMVHLANATARMLVEADPEFESLEDLFAREALADETDWLCDFPQ
jgi:hypothetical protein